MKKYIQPQTRQYTYQTEGMIAASLQISDQEGDQHLSNYRDSWYSEDWYDTDL